MSESIHSHIRTGILAGSLWAFAEVVLGVALRAAALPLRSTLLSGLGVGILFAAFAACRRTRVVLLAATVAVLGRAALTVLSGTPVSLTNGTLALLLTGGLTALASGTLRTENDPSPVRTGLVAGAAILAAGTLFHVLGSRFDPCPYLSGMTATDFFWKETARWAVLSAVFAPLGFRTGTALRRITDFPQRKTLAWGVIWGCWAGCGLAMMIT